MKRIFSLLLALVLVFGLIPGTAFAAAKPIELTVWADSFQFEWLQNRLDAFEAANPQWDITWNIEDYFPGYAEVVIAEDPAAGGDVYLYYSSYLNTLLEAGAVLPLTAAETRQALANSTQTLVDTVSDLNGTCYGYPLAGNTWFMLYNKSVFSEEDVKSLDTMLEKGKVAFPMTNIWYLPAFYFANGGTMYGPRGNNEADGIRFNGSRGAAVTARLAELMEHPNFITEDYGIDTRILADGTCDALFGVFWDYTSLREQMGDDIGAAQLPTVNINGQPRQMKALMESISVGVNPHADHPEAARALAAFLSNADSQLLRWQLHGSAVAAASLIDHPSITSHPGAKAMLDTQNNTAAVHPWVPSMSTYWVQVAEMAQWLKNGKITAGNAAAKTEEWNAILNGGRELPPIFSDVPAGVYYEEPVLWAVENGITAGASANSFNPGGSCLRAHVVTFLWRAAGCPEPISTENPFTDVKEGEFFYKPVLWAVENAITSGVSATEFGSYANCNRAAVVTFLWRAAGSPEPSSTNNPFTDVKSTDFFYKPVLWAVENGITAGLTATTFGPTAECNRAQVVTFLYRAYN